MKNCQCTGASVKGKNAYLMIRMSGTPCFDFSLTDDLWGINSAKCKE